MALLRSGNTKIDIGEFKKSLYEQFGKGARLQGKFYDEIQEIAVEATQDMIDEINSRTSMRESQASGDPYFRGNTVHRNIHNKPFGNAFVATDAMNQSVVSVSVSAPVTSNKGVTVDIFKIIDEGRQGKTSSKKIIYPITSGSLFKKNLSSIKRTNQMFSGGSVRYVRDRKGKIKMYVGHELSKIEGRDILGVLAKEIEARIAKYNLRFVKGQPVIGRGVIKVKVDR